MKIYLSIMFFLSGIIVPEVLLTFWKYTEIDSKLGYVFGVVSIWIYGLWHFQQHLKEQK